MSRSGSLININFSAHTVVGFSLLATVIKKEIFAFGLKVHSIQFGILFYFAYPTNFLFCTKTLELHPFEWFLVLQHHIITKTVIARQVSSMIHSSRPTVSPVVNIVFAWNLFCFEKWGQTYRRTNGRHVQKQWSLPAVTVGWPRGSTSKIHDTFTTKIIKLSSALKENAEHLKISTNPKINHNTKSWRAMG